MSVPDAGADADLLAEAFEAVHPGFTRYATPEQMDRAAADLRVSAQQNPSAGELYLAVQKYLATIRCEHTEADLPVGLRARLASSMLPVAFSYVPDATGVNRAVIIGVAEGVESVRVGDEIVAVDGHPMGEVFGAMSPYISVDGFTDHTKPTIFSGSDDIGLTTFDILYPLLFGERESFRVLVESSDGDRREVELVGVDESASLNMRGVGAGSANFGDEGAVRWTMLDDRTAGLWISTFVNYRTPVNPDEVFAPVFEAINESGAERLVLDFRNVGGGSGDVQGSLLRHLLAEPATFGGPARVRTFEFDTYREHLHTWAEGAFDMPAELFTPDGEFYIVDPAVAGGESRFKPAANAWRGELAILCGPNNESGATMLLAELREQRELTLIGEPTGGSAEGPTAGVIAFLTLPNSGIVARLPLVWSRTSATAFEPGQGVMPDVRSSMTAESLRAGDDPAMAAAMRGPARLR